MSAPLQFSDASFTDGQAAIWGGALTTPMLLTAIGPLAPSRLAAIEVLNPAVVDACIARAENPLQRVELARRRCPDVPLRATVNLLTGHGRRQADVLGPGLIGPWLRALAAAGIAQVVLLDALQDQHRMFEAVRDAIAAGLSPIAALPYMADPEVDDAAYARRAHALAGTGAHRVMLRDESGVLTPDRARSLLPALREALAGVPLDLHTRCQTALGPWLALEAARLGIAGIDTALPCVANGASLPALPLLLRSLARLGVETPAPPAQHLAAANDALAAVADQEGFPAALPWVFDLAPFAHQLPAEVAARFMEQLRERGQWQRVHAFAAECAAVRADMGRPPMLAPFAQAIAEQAMDHFLGKPRYQSLRPVLRRLLQGVYGTPPGPLDAALQRRVGRIETEPAAPADLGRASPQALLALVAGVDARDVPGHASLAALRYETVPPAVALARGMLQRAPRYALLSASGAGIDVRLALGA
jgi:oxaloacetate decarboxylase (Na+ extruding) subunit alpha